MLICGPDAAGQRSQPDLDCGHLGGSVLPPCPGPSGMVSGIPGLHPPNARTSPPPPSCDNQKCLQKLLDVPGDGGHSTQPRTGALSVGRHGSPSSLPPVRGLAPSPCLGDRPGPLLGPPHLFSLLSLQPVPPPILQTAPPPTSSQAQDCPSQSQAQCVRSRDPSLGLGGRFWGACGLYLEIEIPPKVKGSEKAGHSWAPAISLCRTEPVPRGWGQR